MKLIIHCDNGCSVDWLGPIVNIGIVSVLEQCIDHEVDKDTQLRCQMFARRPE